MKKPNNDNIDFLIACLLFITAWFGLTAFILLLLGLL